MEKISFKKYLKARIKDKGFIIIIIAFLLFQLFASVYFCINYDLRKLLMSSLFMLFVPAIFIIEHLIKIKCGELFTFGILFLASGSILGSCFDLYTTFPVFDTILHGMSGVIFGCLGFSLAEKFFGKTENKKTFFGCLVFAICFSLAIACVWEIFEYTTTALLGFDMMEDAYITDIYSYLLSGGHTEMVEVEGITKTIIYYGNGKILEISGYLDIGLIDTLTDMIICTIGTLIFAIICIVSYIKFPKINKILIPQNVRENK